MPATLSGPQCDGTRAQPCWACTARHEPETARNWRWKHAKKQALVRQDPEALSHAPQNLQYEIHDLFCSLFRAVHGLALPLACRRRGWTGMAVNQTVLTQELEALIPSIWNSSTYRTYYDEAFCLLSNVTYSNRANAEGPWCTRCLPGQGCPPLFLWQDAPAPISEN